MSSGLQKYPSPFSVTSQHTGHVRRIAGLLFGRHLFNSTLLVLFCFALSGAIVSPTELIRDPDVWWHLANARLLFATHHFLRADPYSFTLHGQPWANPAWLGEVPYWLSYRWLGMRGVHLLAVLVLCANVLFVYFRSCAKSRHIVAAFWMAVPGIFLIAVNAGARTIGFAYLALSAEMALLEAAESGRHRLLWFLPPLFSLWINLHHGSWVVGLQLFALYTLCSLFRLHAGVFEQESISPQYRNQLLKIFAASVVCLFVNPYGWQLIWSPFDMLFKQRLMLAVTEEWQPLNLGNSLGKSAAVAIILAIVANCVRARKWKLYELAFIFFTWYLAFDHQRFTFLACVVTLPLFTADAARAFLAPASNKTYPVLNGLIAAGVIVGLALHLPTSATLEQDLARATPLRTIASIQPSWRTFNDLSIGGLMDFASKPVFIDSRNELFEGPGILKDYLDIESLQNSQFLLDKYRIDHALIRTHSALAALLSLDPHWQVEMREGSGADSFVLFARKTSAPSQ